MSRRGSEVHSDVMQRTDDGRGVIGSPVRHDEDMAWPPARLAVSTTTYDRVMREARMGSLEAVLATVRDRIGRYGGQVIGESNTKSVLIEPVLRALGWDVEDLDEVRREFRRKPGDNPVDYALFLLRTPRLFVEAKALRESLDDDRWAKQIMGYASVTGVKWIVLTNGNEYRIYNSHASVPYEEKLFRQVEVASGERGVADVLGLLSKARLQDNQIDVLWRADFVDRQVKETLQELFTSDAPTDFLRLVRRRLPSLAPSDIRASFGRALVTIDYPVLVPAEEPQPEPRRQSGPAPEAKPEGAVGDKTPWRSVTLRDLITSGLIRPPLDIETRYKGHTLRAVIEADGSVTWDGTRYESLSLAGGMARKSIVGAPPGREYPPTNGWTFWRFRDADGHLAFVDVLRQRYVEG